MHINKRTAIKWICGNATLLAAGGCGPQGEEGEPVATAKENIDESRFGDYEVVLSDGLFNGSPAVLNVDGKMNHLEVYGVGTDQYAWYARRTQPGAAWTGWYFLGGPAGGFEWYGPAVTMFHAAGPPGQAATRRALALTGNDGQLWISVTTTGGYLPWGIVPNSGVVGAPALTFRKPYLFMVIRREDHMCYWSRNDVSTGLDNTRWTKWKQIPHGVLKQGPAVTSDGSRIVIAGLGNDNRIWINDSTNSGEAWSGWKPAVYDAGTKQFSSGPAISFHGTSVEVAARGHGGDAEQHSIYVATVNPTTGWASEWVSAMSLFGWEAPASAADRTSASGRYAVAATLSSGQRILMTTWE